VEFVNYIGSMLLAMLPPRYRANRRLRSPAIASAILECFLAVSVLLGRIYTFIPRPGMVSDKLADDMFVKHGGEFIVANAVGGASSFWMDPLILVCLYFFFESVFRVFAAIEGNNIVVVLPLYSISLVHGFLDRVVQKRYLGPLVIDRNAPGGTGAPPRRFIYYLRKWTIGRLVVVIRKYKPEDVLNYR
jgi:hypothetical protein